MPSATERLMAMYGATTARPDPTPQRRDPGPVVAKPALPGVTRPPEPGPGLNWDASVFAPRAPAAPSAAPLAPPPDVKTASDDTVDAVLSMSGVALPEGLESLYEKMDVLVRRATAQGPAVREPNAIVDEFEVQDAMAMSEQLSTQIMEATEAHEMGTMQRYKQAEVETQQAIGDAETEAKYGMPAEDLRVISQVFDAAAANPDDGELAAKAQEAASMLQQAQQTAQNPDPFRLWHDMGTGKQALFLFANALAIMGQAVSGKGGPTPMDMLQNMMERDYQAARDAYARREGKITKARSAYEIAVKMTNNEMERHALVMAQKWGAFEREAARLNLGMHADQARQQKAQWLLAAQFQRFSQEQDSSVSLLKELIGMATMSARFANQNDAYTKIGDTPREQFVSREDVVGELQVLAALMQGQALPPVLAGVIGKVEWESLQNRIQGMKPLDRHNYLKGLMRERLSDKDYAIGAGIFGEDVLNSSAEQAQRVLAAAERMQALNDASLLAMEEEQKRTGKKRYDVSGLKAARQRTHGSAVKRLQGHAGGFVNPLTGAGPAGPPPSAGEGW